jgi:DNA invertase Pin-like site-specific DNA recombinase
MEYYIPDIIKRLTKAQKQGKELITEKELLQIAVPVINDIDRTIDLIDKGIKKVKDENFGEWRVRHITISEATKYVNISRQTLYRWKEKGIISSDISDFDLIELKKNILEIKEIHKNVTN